MPEPSLMDSIQQFVRVLREELVNGKKPIIWFVDLENVHAQWELGSYYFVEGDIVVLGYTDNVTGFVKYAYLCERYKLHPVWLWSVSGKNALDTTIMMFSREIHMDGIVSCFITNDHGFLRYPRSVIMRPWMTLMFRGDEELIKYIKERAEEREHGPKGGS